MVLRNKVKNVQITNAAKLRGKKYISFSPITKMKSLK